MGMLDNSIIKLALKTVLPMMDGIEEKLEVFLTEKADEICLLKGITKDQIRITGAFAKSGKILIILTYGEEVEKYYIKDVVEWGKSVMLKVQKGE